MDAGVNGDLAAGGAVGALFDGGEAGVAGVAGVAGFSFLGSSFLGSSFLGSSFLGSSFLGFSQSLQGALVGLTSSQAVTHEVTGVAVCFFGSVCGSD